MKAAYDGMWRAIVLFVFICFAQVHGFNLAPRLAITSSVCPNIIECVDRVHYPQQTCRKLSATPCLTSISHFSRQRRLWSTTGPSTSSSTSNFQPLVLESLPLSNDQTGQYVGNEATTLALSTISAVIGFLTASCVFYTKSIIFGVNRSTLTRFPHIMPIVAGASVMLLIKTEPNVKKPPKLWLGEEQSRDAYKVMWRQLLLRWIGAIISIGGGAALGTAGMSAEIGILITYLLLVVVRPTLQITPAQQRMLLLAASAAGAAANFNAPITGVIYALEVTSKLLPGSTSTSLEKDDHKKKLLLLMTCATLFATLCIRSGYFVPPFKSSLDWGIGLGTDYNALQALVTYGVLGVLSGILFKAFSHTRSSFAKFYQKFGDHSGPLIAGIVTAATGTPQSIPAGFVEVNKIIAKSVTGLEGLKFFISKFITVSSAGMSGFLGGQIAPLLFVGSGFGALFHRLISIFAPFVLDGHNINAFGIICGAALVGCNFENIFFPTVLVAEMTRSMEPTLGVMLTTAIATLVVKM